MSTTVKQQATQIASALPQVLQGPAMAAIAAAPDVPLPVGAPQFSTGRSMTLTLPSVLNGMGPASVTVPTPMESLRAAEGLLPAGVPKLSSLLGGNGGQSPPPNKTAEYRKTSDGDGKNPSRPIQAGGYRPTS